MTVKVQIKNLREVEVSIDKMSTRSTKAFDALLSFVLGVRTDIQLNSPVGIGEGAGAYRRAWKITEQPGSSMVVLTNDRPYAGVLEEGSPLGEKPWPSPGPRTVVVDGKVRPSQWPQPVAQTAVDQADWSVFNRLIEDMLS